MTVKEIYDYFERVIPRSLSCEWDNDGLMCSPDLSAQVRKVVLALDITKDTVGYAKSVNADMIISHHPLIFRPLKTVNEEAFTAAKIIDFLKNGISAMSFHTRLDALEGGVNDVLADIIGLSDVDKICSDGECIARIGTVNECDIDSFARFVKKMLGCDFVCVIDGGKKVNRVAVCGGDGKSYLAAARLRGADTYVTGSMSYNAMLDAYDMGINVIEAGHYFTEVPVLKKIARFVKEADPEISILYYGSNAVKTY